jgi:cobalt/nickel transport system ATP-binding protein
MIKIENLSFSYQGGKKLFDNASFSLGDSDSLGLCGANGSGKSAFLQVTAGLLRPSSGRIEFFGKEMRLEKNYREIRSKIGYLFQDPDDQLFCPIVEEEIAFGLFNIGKKRDEIKKSIAEILSELELGGYEKKYTSKLSGGEKRLVSLAAILVMKPEILLLDEPSAGLDEKSKNIVARILNASGSSKIIVSHDGDFLEKTVSSSLTLKDGKIG